MPLDRVPFEGVLCAHKQGHNQGCAKPWWHRYSQSGRLGWMLRCEPAKSNTFKTRDFLKLNDMLNESIAACAWVQSGESILFDRCHLDRV